MKSILYAIVALFTAVVAYQININANSNFPLFWAIVDMFFWFIAWLKWLLCQQVSVSVIKAAFAFFLA